jgi:hypothetical protein
MTLPFLLASVLFYVNTPVIDMREGPNDSAEVVSQAYYTEQVNILEEAPEWLKIETVLDHYQGWIKNKGLCERETEFLSNTSSVVAKVNRCAAHLYGFEDTVYGPILTLPFDSRLEVIEPKGDSNSRWIKVALVDGREAFIQRGDVTLNTDLLDRVKICSLSLKFLNLPYTWGGRSSFGYDCSGFVQMLYRQMGLYIPRDSKDQIRWEKFKSISLEELAAGDLIFFGLDQDKIRHVGLYLGDQKFIHSTVAENAPYIRISDLTDAEWNGSGRFAYRAARTLVD